MAPSIWVGMCCFSLHAGVVDVHREILPQVLRNRSGSHKRSTAFTIGCNRDYLASKFIAPVSCIILEIWPFHCSRNDWQHSVHLWVCLHMYLMCFRLCGFPFCENDESGCPATWFSKLTCVWLYVSHVALTEVFLSFWQFSCLLICFEINLQVGYVSLLSNAS